jgi:2-polyprenyl-3-methyl-5-hydroxy-6-metoxy-1,4-benzoquinol methylase
MTDEFKLHWELHYQWYSNEKIKIGFKNLLDKYLFLQSGKIIDIGCGQSPYLINMLNSNFELYALDIEPLQIEYLKKRVADSSFPIDRINYSIKKFPSKDFENFHFAGIVLSNILQFYTFLEAIEFTDVIKKSIVKDGIIVITVHSWKHFGNKESKKDYFKHFYAKSDLYKLFPKKEYDYMYVNELESYPDKEQIAFINEWIKQVHLQIWNKNDVALIEKKQKEYLAANRTNNITVVLKRR